ncbi:MAG: serine/threonine protein kinase [Planctomycetota bacterium]
MSSKAERLLIEVSDGTIAPAELPRSGMMVIGSSEDKAGLCIPSQGVADVHCAIGMTKDGSFAIKDMGSEYGTLLNGTKITQARLQKGDQIMIGSVRLRVIAAKGATPPANSAKAPEAAKKNKAKAAPQKSSKVQKPRIAGYKVHQRLGYGAMGDVFLAVQESLDREVAIKVLSKAHEQDQAFVESFQAEARSAAALNHPNVVTVHDVGEAHGVHYLTMEYMDRGSLETRVTKEGPLPWPLVLTALKDAASGLVYAESRGIVHRDIKPANLMQNHTGVTKIADLGLATSISHEEAPDGDRKIFGTPHFISPEQVKGEKADCRSDLYSLGSTAYRLLTGHTPFEGNNTREILRAKLRGEYTPIREHASDVSPLIEAIVGRMMELEPTDRYPSAVACLREIENMEAGAKQAGAPATGGSDKSNLIKFAVPAILVVVLAGGAAMMFGGDDSSDSSNSGPSSENSLAHANSGGFGETALSDPELLPLTDVGETGNTGDSDIEEQLFESAAENALLKLSQKDLLLSERRDVLRKLASEFLGTTAASEAMVQATTIDRQIEAAKLQAEERDSRVGDMFKLLTAAAGLEDTAMRPGNALRAMKAVKDQGPLEADDSFIAQRTQLEEQVISIALGQFEGLKESITSQQASGDFEGMKETLLDLLGRCDLPVYAEGTAPKGVTEILELKTQLQAQLNSIDLLKSEFATKTVAQDKQKIGSGMKSLGAQIKSLDFEAASLSCQALDASLQSEDAQAWNANLQEHLDSAARAIPIIALNFSEWRRTKVENPEDSSGKARDAVGATKSGLVITDKGSTVEIPWGSFGGNTKAIGTLFSKRLSRQYTESELQSIGHLMHFAALAECLDQAGEMFASSGNAIFTPKEARDLPIAFEIARDWIQGEEDLAALDLDLAACLVLGEALSTATEGEWTTSVGHLEQLFIDYSDSWLVRILSDGTPITLPH